MLELFSIVDICSALTNRSKYFTCSDIWQEIASTALTLACAASVFLACADSLIAINVSRRVSLLFGAFGFKTMADQSWTVIELPI